MRIIIIAALLTLVSAHDINNVNRMHRRQASLASSSSSSASPSNNSPPPQTSSTSNSPGPSPTDSSSSSPTGSSSSSTGAVTGTPTSTTSTVSRVTTTPIGPGTDIPPLSSIVSGANPEATASLAQTYPAGAIPPIKGAPPLPKAFVFNSADWPAQDKVPDTTTPQVQQWLKEIEGFFIPNLAPTTDGTCVNNPQMAQDAANRGWWTCGGYTRPTDIVSCPDKLTWGVSFDDGPAAYTQKLLNYLNANNIKSTFFVVGSRVIERPSVLIEEYMSGHEISVHTWSHRPLTELTNEQIVAELGWTRHAIQTVLGVTPVTMRPPYGDIDDRVRAISLAMGMVPIIWTRSASGQQFDTNDWRVPGGLVNGTDSFASFQSILGNATQLDTGFIVLEHDLFQQTVDLGVGYFLPTAQAFTPKLTLEPIGQCQHWPNTDLYLETTTNTTFPYLNVTISSGSGGSVSTTAPARAAAASEAKKNGASSYRTTFGIGSVQGLLVGAAMTLGAALVL